MLTIQFVPDTAVIFNELRPRYNTITNLYETKIQFSITIGCEFTIILNQYRLDKQCGQRRCGHIF